MSGQPEPEHSRSVALQRGLALLSILLAAAVIYLYIELERARTGAPGCAAGRAVCARAGGAGG